MKLTAKLARQHFACTRMRAILTRGACARAHQIASIEGPKAGRDALSTCALDRCRGCTVGAEHRRGVATQPQVALVPLRVEWRPPVRRCHACGHQLPPHHGRKNYCNFACYNDGRTLTLVERAAEMGS